MVDLQRLNPKFRLKALYPLNRKTLLSSYVELQVAGLLFTQFEVTRGELFSEAWINVLKLLVDELYLFIELLTQVYVQGRSLLQVARETRGFGRELRELVIKADRKGHHEHESRAQQDQEEFGD